MSGCIDINESRFEEELLKNKQTILVDFWAPWCGPCKTVLPVLEKISQHYGDKLKVFKINIDENEKLSRKFGIMSIPTLIIFKNSEKIETRTGVLQKSQLIEILDKHI